MGAGANERAGVLFAGARVVEGPGKPEMSIINTH